MDQHQRACLLVLTIAFLTAIPATAQPVIGPETQVAVLYDPVGSPTARHLTTGDVDGDGDEDVIVSAMVPSSQTAQRPDPEVSLTWFKNLGNGTLGPGIAIGLVPERTRYVPFDVDGDGLLDIVTASIGSETAASTGPSHAVRWFPNVSGGVFGAPIPIHGPTSALVPHPLSLSSASSEAVVGVGDLDGDGDQDVVFNRELSVVWSENLGGGAFAPPQQVLAGQEVVAVLVARLDPGANANILVMTAVGDVLTLENQPGLPGPVFNAQQIGSVGSTDLGRLHAADLDGDGDLDVAFSGDGGADVLENVGGGVFAPFYSPNLAGAAWITSSDIDGDGSRGLLVARVHEIEWLVNAPGHAFGGGWSHHIPGLGGPFGAHSIGSADLDGDGDQEIISAWGGHVYAFENLHDVPVPGPTAVLSATDDALTGFTVSVQSPSPMAPIFVFMDSMAGAVPLGPFGYTQVALSPEVIALSDPTQSFGPSISQNTSTDPAGSWQLAFPTALLSYFYGFAGTTLYLEAYVIDPTAPNSLFFQSNLETFNLPPFP